MFVLLHTICKENLHFKEAFTPLAFNLDQGQQITLLYSDGLVRQWPPFLTSVYLFAYSATEAPELQTHRVGVKPTVSITQQPSWQQWQVYGANKTRPLLKGMERQI